MAGSLGTAVMTHRETSVLGLLNPDWRLLKFCLVSSMKNHMALELEACLDSISLTLCGHHSRLATYLHRIYLPEANAWGLALISWRT